MRQIRYVVPFFIAAILIELVWTVFKGKGGRYEIRDTLTSLIIRAPLIVRVWSLSWDVQSTACGVS